jgi:hypothetical protein
MHLAGDRICPSICRPSSIVPHPIRSGLPAACDQCGAPAFRLVPVLYGRAAQTGLVGDVYYGGCVVVLGAPTWICPACGHWGVVVGGIDCFPAVRPACAGGSVRDGGRVTSAVVVPSQNGGIGGSEACKKIAHMAP